MKFTLSNQKTNLLPLLSLFSVLGIGGLSVGCASTPVKQNHPSAIQTSSFAKRNLASSLDYPGALTSGFRLQEMRPIKEADGVARIFVHEKTGAKLLYLSNNDDNKVFSIGFRTPPHDNTGVAHILEHSVLCGSKKFPSKEPFVELLKGSVNTFVNAMTYSDKTVYPVASRNDKDFKNLMDVYLDAVLHPNIYQNPFTLMQEGWHYELNEKTKELEYNGVVYNEMKGALSSPDRLLGSLLQRALFPHNTYDFESGGDPQEIPQLTPKKFLGFHERYYHPSNSYLYLYGNGNIEEHLSMINDQYLQDFSKKEIPSEIPLEPTFQRPKVVQDFYSINPGDTTQGKTYMSMSYVIGRSTDPEIFLALDILEYLLIDTDSSPLKRALLEANVGKSIEGYWDPTIQQPVLAILVKSTNPDQKTKFQTVLKKTLQDLVKNGIPSKLIEAAINRKEFLLREFETQGTPKGLAYYDKIMDSWLYGGDPLVHLTFEPTLAKIKAQAYSGYFENLISQYLLKNPHRVTVLLQPQPGLDVKKAEITRKRLKKYQSKLKPKELQEIVSKTQELKQRQQTPDTPENLEKIPLLNISDINPQAEKLPIREALENTPPSDQNYKIFHHNVFTNQIGYLSLYFDISAASAEEIPALSLLTEVLGKMNTETKPFQELSTELDTHTGGMSQSIKAFAHKSSLNILQKKYIVQSKVLLTKLPKLITLLDEILLHTKFENASRLKEIIQEVKSRIQDSIISSGHRYAMYRTASYISQTGRLNELATGISYYHFLAKLEKEIEKNPEKVLSNLKQLAQNTFSRTQLTISFVAPEKDFANASSQLHQLADSFPALPNQNFVPLEVQADNEGLMIPSKVQYVVRGADFRKLGFEYSGKMLVANNLISNDYLWNKVRVLGGAYGSWMSVSRPGGFYMISYRDPGLTETFEAYQKAADYLKNIELSPREVTKYILGTISELDLPLTPSSKGSVAMSNHFSGITPMDIQNERNEVLSTQVSELKTLSDLVNQAMQQNYFSVVGNENKIRENQRLFGKIVQVME